VVEGLANGRWRRNPKDRALIGPDSALAAH
jgi:hypothetical protein